MAAKKKPTAAHLPSETDPRAPLDAAQLLAASQRLLTELEADLLARARASASVREALRLRHEAERGAKRTADPLEVWERHFVTQVAASWLLSCVFVRTLEDRGLLGHNRIAGPGATDSQRLFFELAPSLTEREYLLTIFRELSRLPAARDLFDARHNPVWMLGPSAEISKKLLSLFRAPNADAPGLRFGQGDTRFLGDLYQDLSADVRERFALLQTPHFVEKYILDRTLERSIARFGLDDTTLIDPTCGSGHFLLGAFERLVDHRLRKEPGLDVREAARKALDAVYGADINPYAVAIARFRLTLAFLDKAGYARLADAPALPLHLVVADSLLHNPQHAQAKLGEVAGQTMKAWGGDEFALEDEAAARDVLCRRFAAVVGNPPYITPKDAALRKRYAEMYPSCHMNYALTVPFSERFFQLAKPGGFVGKITANSFMKREFGKKLIESYLPTVNLDGVVNTSGAYIPGHGTPTVLLFGSNEPKEGDDVLTVLAKRGEPSTPADPEQGFVWRSIAEHGSEVGFDDEYISVARIARSTLEKHPWSLGGGGAAELKELLESRAPHRLADVIDDVGFSVIVGEDEVFLRPAGAMRTRSLPTIPIVIGELVRDWSISITEEILRPFTPDTFDVTAPVELVRELWPWKTTLENRIVSGSVTMKDSRREWYDVRRLSRDKHRAKMSIAFAFVATHNHFVLDRGGKVFNRSAPIIKLKEGATEEDHLALLAYLNSSTACFWMKQVMMNKGGSGIGRGVQDEAWESRFEFDGTKMATVPVPANLRSLAPLARKMLSLAEAREQTSPMAMVRAGAPADELAKARAVEADILAQMVALQEQLDVTVYQLYGLVESPPIVPVSVEPGQRAFERRLIAENPGTDWFARHGYAVPAPSTSMDLSPEVRLIEDPAFKRRWIKSAWDDGIRSAKQSRDLDAAEQSFIGSIPEIHTARSILRHFEHTADYDSSLRQALVLQSVPFLATLRHTDAGLEKRAEWVRVWDVQRAEDRGEKLPPFDPPPKYDQKDYRDANCWRLRGKLDVPKERFISYPGCESDEDKEPVYGWAGWNHLQQAQALAALYQRRKTEESWGKERLTPMLAGLLELTPWVKQWHNAPSAEFGGLRLGDYFDTFLDGECHALGLTREDLRAWRPADKSKGKKAAEKKAKAEAAGPESDGDPAPKRRERKKKDAPAGGGDPS